MNPLIIDLARSPHLEIADHATLVHQADSIPFWSAVGGCLGGNGTMIEASAHIEIVDLVPKAECRTILG